MNRIQKRIIKEMFMDNNWVEHNGNVDDLFSKVSPDDEVIVRFRDGEESSSPIEAYIYRWTHGDNDYDIVAYKVVKRAKSEVTGETIDFHGTFEKMSEEEQDQIINPKHYKMIPKEAYEKFPEGLEYMNLMEYILGHHKGVEAHLLGQIFKYSCRLGKKDADLQDARKIQWYANYLVKVIEGRSK